MSLFLKALPLMALRHRPCLLFLCRVPNTLIPREFSRTRTLSSVSASIQQSPSETLIKSNAKPSHPLPYKDSLEWVSRTDFCGELSLDDVGKRVMICGWVALHRVHGGLTFFNLRDQTGIVQVTTLPDEFPDAHSAINDLRLEYVIAIEGIVRSRPNESINKKMKTGLIEVAAHSVQVLNAVNSKLPFLVTTADDAKDSLKEEIRLRYRCLDLRRQQMSSNILLWHKVVKLIRRYLEDIHGFVEIETPILSRSTPEGARDYLVPSRIQTGTFYALPQSPQLFKQMLMVAGFDKYYQVARFIFWVFRDRLFCLVEDVAAASSNFWPFISHKFIQPRTYSTPRNLSRVPSVSSSGFLQIQRSNIFGSQSILRNWLHARYISNASVELRTDNDVVRFSLSKADDINTTTKSRKKKVMSKKAKVNELRFYRLKAKKKMNSPNPEVRIRYKLEKAKRKETWLIAKLRKFDMPKPQPETFDPEILTEEERHYLKRTGERKKHYVPVGRRGVFGGVVLNMHLHWKNHETVKVICKPCQPGKIHEYAKELARLSKGIVIDIMHNNTIIFYRGKNYVQPKVMSPPDTLSKAKALEKYRYEQSLEHTSQFIERLEKELEEYHYHVAKFKKRKEECS